MKKPELQVRHFPFRRHRFDDDAYEIVVVDWVDDRGYRREAQLLVSPAGRSVQVHVDGEKWEAPE